MVHCFYFTYEELKQKDVPLPQPLWQRLYFTYEELKLPILPMAWPS